MLDRTLAPPFNRSTRFELIHPESIKLPNGIDIHFIAGGKQDVIKVEFVLKAGRWYESQWGMSYFTSNLLSKGTSKKSSFDIARTFDQYGSHFEVGPGLDVVSVSLYSLIKNLEPTLALLLEVITDAVFPEKELSQQKAIYLQNLRVNQEKTSFQASKLFRKNVFGDVHPYGKELEEQDVNLLTQTSLRSFHAQFFKDAFVLVSGKIPDAVKKNITQQISSFTSAVSDERQVSSQETQPFRQWVDKPGSVQSTIRMGKRFINRRHPDYYDVLLLNHIFGGYFGSRLMKNIREDKGLSYGIYSSIHTLQHDSYMVIGSDVNKENLNVTFEEIRKEMKRLRHEKMDDQELETARNHFIGSLQSEITTPFAHAEKFKNMLLFRLPPDYYQRMISRLDQLTAEDLIEVAEKYWNEDSFFEVAVG
jgi:predicted Zn-dependent peptidase